MEFNDSVKVNDSISLYDSKTPRSYLFLTRVIKVHPSKDGLVTSVALKLRYTTIVRPVNKLCLLEESK